MEPGGLDVRHAHWIGKSSPPGRAGVGAGGAPGRGRAWWEAHKAPLTLRPFQPPFTAENRKKTMDKIIKGKLVLPPYLTPDARDLVKKVGSLLPLVWLPSLPRPCMGSRVSLACGEPEPPCLWAGGVLALGSQTLSVGCSSAAEQLLTWTAPFLSPNLQTVHDGLATVPSKRPSAGAQRGRVGTHPGLKLAPHQDSPG